MLKGKSIKLAINIILTIKVVPINMGFEILWLQNISSQFIAPPIVQIRTRAEKNLGLTWFISGYNRLGDSSNSTYTAASYGFNTSNYTPLISPDNFSKLSNIPVLDNTLALGILNKTQTLKVELALKAMELDGDAQVVSSPKVLTLDNQEASIEQGIEIPYTESTVASGGATSYNINFKKASLILKVKPHIARDNKIVLDLEVRKDSPNYDYVNVTGSNEPAINTRNVKSKVIVENGSTVVIGGIYEKERSKTTTGVPGLSRIPLLGWLFKTTNTTVSKSQLLIFITPTLVTPEGELREGGE
jgi:type IV pilus assembly protein PilQ